MILLIHEAEAGTDPAGETRFGGPPSVPAGPFAWPTCATCSGPMQFLGQIRVTHDGSDRLLLLFMCQNDPGLCEEWDADAGGNAALVVAPTGLVAAAVPTGGETRRPERYGARIVAVDGDDYEAARAGWEARQGPKTVLGALGGDPFWIQGDQTPACDACGRPMRFVALLEEGPGEGMNFGGGGCAYVFECGAAECGAPSAKLLWQC